jgi:hypothetical protein
VQAGGSPAAAHFSCFAKKSKQKKAKQASPPFGFPIVLGRKWESLETRLRLKHKAFFIHFSPSTIGGATCEKAKIPKDNKKPSIGIFNSHFTLINSNLAFLCIKQKRKLRL